MQAKSNVYLTEIPSYIEIPSIYHMYLVYITYTFKKMLILLHYQVLHQCMKIQAKI